MRAMIGSVLAALFVLTCVGLAQADEPKSEGAKKDKESVSERQQRRKEALEVAANGQDFDKALAVLEEMVADKEVADEDKIQAYHLQFQILVKEKPDQGAKACLIAKKLSELKKDDPELLNELAWFILDTENLKNRDLDVAMAIAKQAAEVSKHESSMILDTLARAYYEKKDLDKAIEFQTKAVEKGEKDDKATDDIKAQMKATLDKYKAEKEKAKK
jgi:tetratricopeptide (TPR) repeat protein